MTIMPPPAGPFPEPDGVDLADAVRADAPQGEGWRISDDDGGRSWAR